MNTNDSSDKSIRIERDTRRSSNVADTEPEPGKTMAGTWNICAARPGKSASESRPRPSRRWRITSRWRWSIPAAVSPIGGFPTSGSRRPGGNEADAWHNCRMVLRLYDVSYITFNGLNANQVQDYPLPCICGQMFFNLSHAGTWQLGEVGFLLRDGEFIPAARSHTVSFPRASTSSYGAQEALLVEEERGRNQGRDDRQPLGSREYPQGTQDSQAAPSVAHRHTQPDARQFGPARVHREAGDRTCRKRPRSAYSGSVRQRCRRLPSASKASTSTRSTCKWTERRWKSPTSSANWWSSGSTSFLRSISSTFTIGSRARPCRTSIPPRSARSRRSKRLG